LPVMQPTPGFIDRISLADHGSSIAAHLISSDRWGRGVG
jgi:hypothetical protein